MDDCADRCGHILGLSESTERRCITLTVEHFDRHASRIFAQDPTRRHGDDTDLWSESPSK